MIGAFLGWKKLIPLCGKLAISVFSIDNSVGLIEIEKISESVEVDSLSRDVKNYMMTNVYDPLVCIMEKDPLDNVEEVCDFLDKLDRDKNIVYSVYVETYGRDEDAFRILLKRQIDHLAVKFTIPPSVDSDHTETQQAVSCLRMAVQMVHDFPIDLSLILIIKEDSNIDVLKRYFNVIQEAFGSDNRLDFAPGAALSAFDIIIRPECKDVEKLYAVQSFLTSSEMDFSQDVLVDTGAFNFN